MKRVADATVIRHRDVFESHGTAAVSQQPLHPAAPWNGGISFGCVVAFIFADLIIIPTLIIYRR